MPYTLEQANKLKAPKTGYEGVKDYIRAHGPTEPVFTNDDIIKAAGYKLTDRTSPALIVLYAMATNGILNRLVAEGILVPYEDLDPSQNGSRESSYRWTGKV